MKTNKNIIIFKKSGDLYGKNLLKFGRKNLKFILEGMLSQTLQNMEN